MWWFPQFFLTPPRVEMGTWTSRENDALGPALNVQQRTPAPEDAWTPAVRVQRENYDATKIRTQPSEFHVQHSEQGSEIERRKQVCFVMP